MRVCFVRHGRTAWNAEQRFLGRTDLPLDDEGLAQVAALAPLRGRWGRVLCSPLLRARQTAASFADEVELVDDLAELDQGDLEGLRAPDAVARHPSFFAAWADDPSGVPIPGGGVLNLACDAALESILAACRGAERDLVVVSHQMVLAAVLATLSGAPLRAWRDFRLPNAGGAALAWDGDELRVLAPRLETPALVAWAQERHA